MAKPSLKIVSPNTVNRTVGRLRRPNAETRTREHLLPAEVEALMDATKGNRLPHRDATMILLAYRHGLRAAAAGLPFKACGYALANAGHDTRSLQAYLGHKNIQHTVRYTELAPTRFKDFWR